MTRLPCTTLIRQINSLYEIGAEFTRTMSHFALFAHFLEALILWQVSQMSYNLSKDVCFLGQIEIRTQMHQPKCHLHRFPVSMEETAWEQVTLQVCVQKQNTQDFDNQYDAAYSP